jgi:hypothetical protein
MKTEECRRWRQLLGAHALDGLASDERAALQAHLEGCSECRAEAASLRSVAQLLPLADPARFGQPAPQPPPELAERVAATIGGEERVAAGRRRRRFGLALGGGAAVLAAAVLALFVLPGGGGGEPEQQVEFGQLPGGAKIYATLEPHAYGTEIHMYVQGVRSGTLCRVYLRGPRGERVAAGTFTYRWGDDATATLSSALDLSRTRAIGVRAGNRTFVAPVGSDRATAAANPDQEDVT